MNIQAVYREQRSVISEYTDMTAMRAALSELARNYIIEIAKQQNLSRDRVAIFATGSLARGELNPHSDVDLLVIYDPQLTFDAAQFMSRLLYPIFDAGIKVDQAMRSLPENRALAAQDMAVAIANIQLRFLYGDAEFASSEVIPTMQAQWRTLLPGKLSSYVDQMRDRHRKVGVLSWRAEPDLKDAQGGLRDAHVHQAIVLAQVCDLNCGLPSGENFDQAYRVIMDARTALQHTTGKPRTVIYRQYSDDVAHLLGYGSSFELWKALSRASRIITYCVNLSIRQASNLFTPAISAQRWPLAEGVVTDGREIFPAKEGKKHSFAVAIKLAAQASRTGLPLSQHALLYCKEAMGSVPKVFPVAVLEDFLILIAHGAHSVNTIEDLDRHGLWEQIFPEWRAIRDMQPQSRYHIYTVDRHILQGLIAVEPLLITVQRPDLLLVATLFHDIGKGVNIRDHSSIGADMIVSIAQRLGFPPRDQQYLSLLVEHHLLLARIAARRDVDDAGTIALVAEKLTGNSVVLETLTALTQADSLATGTHMWNSWKKHLIDRLSRNVRNYCHNETDHEARARYCAHIPPGGPGEFALTVEPFMGHDDAHDAALSVMCLRIYSAGELAVLCGVLATRGVMIHSAYCSDGPEVRVSLVVEPLFGELPQLALVRQFCKIAWRNPRSLWADIARRANNSQAQTVAAHISWHHQDSDRVIIDIRAHDQIGLLAHIVHILVSHQLRLHWIKATTVAGIIHDSIAVSAMDSQRFDPAAIEAEMRAVL